jgi:hypothetical protein
MAIGTTALLVSGLLIGAGQMMDDRQLEVARAGAEDVGSAIMSELVMLDTHKTSGASTSSILSRNPDRIAGNNYRIELDGTGSTASVTVSVSNTEPDVRYTTRFDPANSICEATVDDGDVFVVFDSTSSCLTLAEER